MTVSRGWAQEGVEVRHTVQAENFSIPSLLACPDDTELPETCPQSNVQVSVQPETKRLL